MLKTHQRRVATAKTSLRKPKIQWFKIIKHALWLTFDTYVFMLFSGIIAAAWVFSYSTQVLKWLFTILPIVLSLVFALSIFNLARDAQKNPKEKSEA